MLIVVSSVILSYSFSFIILFLWVSFGVFKCPYYIFFIEPYNYSHYLNSFGLIVCPSFQPWLIRAVFILSVPIYRTFWYLNSPWAAKSSHFPFIIPVHSLAEYGNQILDSSLISE